MTYVIVVKGKFPWMLELAEDAYMLAWLLIPHSAECSKYPFMCSSISGLSLPRLFTENQISNFGNNSTSPGVFPSEGS